MYKVFFKESCFLLTDNQNLLKEGEYPLGAPGFYDHENFIYQTLEKGIPFKAVLYDEDPEICLLFSSLVSPMSKPEEEQSYKIPIYWSSND